MGLGTGDRREDIGLLILRIRTSGTCLDEGWGAQQECGPVEEVQEQGGSRGHDREGNLRSLILVFI